MAINAPLKRNCFTSTRSANTIAAKHQPKQPQELTSYSSLAMRGSRRSDPAQKGIKRAKNRCGFKPSREGKISGSGRGNWTAQSATKERERKEKPSSKQRQSQRQRQALFFSLSTSYSGGQMEHVQHRHRGWLKGRCCCIRRLFGGAFSPYRTKARRDACPIGLVSSSRGR